MVNREGSGSSILAPAAERPVEFYVVQHPAYLRQHQSQLRGVGTSVTNQDFQTTGGAASVADIGKPALSTAY
jgi:hypothetical protein